jgi:hypothetical protein
VRRERKHRERERGSAERWGERKCKSKVNERKVGDGQCSTVQGEMECSRCVIESVQNL